jgi:hypothetical protein
MLVVGKSEEGERGKTYMSHVGSDLAYLDQEVESSHPFFGA